MKANAEIPEKKSVGWTENGINNGLVSTNRTV